MTYSFVTVVDFSIFESTGCIILGLISGPPIFLFSLRWTLGVIYYGFRAIVYNALPYPPAIMVVWWVTILFGCFLCHFLLGWVDQMFPQATTQRKGCQEKHLSPIRTSEVYNVDQRIRVIDTIHSSPLP